MTLELINTLNFPKIMAESSRAYLEIWLKGFANEELKRLSPVSTEKYHPHVTIVRPFNFDHDEKSKVMALVSGYCNGKESIPFALEGMEVFNTGEIYVPVVSSQKLIKFSEGLERVLASNVSLVKKPERETKLHATIKTEEIFGLDKNLINCPRIEQYMLRLTAISDGLVWFSYDFERQQLLNRAYSIDPEYWKDTVKLFSKRTGLIPTINGFKKVD